MSTRLSTHGSFCSFLADLRDHWRVASRLRDAAAWPHRLLRPSDGQRGHTVKSSWRDPHLWSPQYSSAGNRTGPATIASLLQQPFLGAKKVGYKPRASKSIYKEGEVKDGDYQVYLEGVISRQLGDIHRPEGSLLPHTGTSNYPKYPRILVGGNVLQFKCLSDCHQPQGSFVGSQESWAPCSTNSPSIFICTWTIGSSEPRQEPSVWHTPR